MNKKTIEIDKADLFCIQTALYHQIRTAREQLTTIQQEFPRGKNSVLYKTVAFVADESEKVLNRIGGSIEDLESEIAKTFVSHFTENN